MRIARTLAVTGGIVFMTGALLTACGNTATPTLSVQPSQPTVGQRVFMLAFEAQTPDVQATACAEWKVNPDAAELIVMAAASQSSGGSALTPTQADIHNGFKAECH